MDIKPFLLFSTHGEYLEKYKTLLRSFKRINIELDSELYFSFRPKVYISHNELVLCACMAIEGFLNFYGARRTYGNWYKENLERIGVTEKLSIIAALYFKDYYSPILIRLKKRTRKLFDTRNSIVHIKSKSITSRDFPAMAKEELIDMSKFSSRILYDFKCYFKSQDPNLAERYF